MSQESDSSPPTTSDSTNPTNHTNPDEHTTSDGPFLTLTLNVKETHTLFHLLESIGGDPSGPRGDIDSIFIQLTRTLSRMGAFHRIEREEAFVLKIKDGYPWLLNPPSLTQELSCGKDQQ